MEEKISLNISIAERSYPLKIDRKDEEKIIKAARLINEKVLLYKQKYQDKDTQDYLAMASLQFVIKLLEAEENNELKKIMQDLRELNEELAEYLATEKIE